MMSGVMASVKSVRGCCEVSVAIENPAKRNKC